MSNLKNPTIADVNNLKTRIHDAGKAITADITDMAGEILALAKGPVPESPQQIVEQVKRIALLGCEMAESWQSMVQLSMADHMANMAGAALEAQEEVNVIVVGGDEESN